MADLLATQAGRDALDRIACFLTRKWSSRNMERGFWIAFTRWKSTGYFDRATMLHDLNPLTQDEIEALDQLLAQLGCLEEVTYPTNIYVDSVNGSDVTGDGSSDYPYESMAFLANFPRRINANVRVLLLNDLDMGTSPLNIDFEMGPNGCFSIIGVGAPTVVNTSEGIGPFTTTAGLNQGTIPADYGHRMTFSESWSSDELYGTWLRFENGANAGEAYPVHRNNGAAGYIFIRGGIEADVTVGGGDIVSFIQPTITLSCQTINIQIDGPKNVYAVTEDCARFNFLNLNIDLRGTYNESHNFILQSSIESQMSFVRLITESSQDTPIILESNLNNYRSADIDIATYAATGLHNLNGAVSQGSPSGLLLYNPDFPPTSYTFLSLIMRHAESIKCVDCRGHIQIDRANIRVEMCGMGIVRGDNGAQIWMERVIMGVGAGQNAISAIYVDSWIVKRIYFTDVGQNIFWLNGANLVHVFPNEYSIAVTFPGYFVYYNIGHSFMLTNQNPPGIATSDIYFPAGVGATVFPAADAMATDSCGNYYSYLLTP